MRTLIALFVLALGMAVTASAQRMDNPMVGGAAMYKTKNIVENAVNSADHTTLVAAVKAAGLVDTLAGPGPFTVFAPTNDAFTKVTDAQMSKWLDQPNQADLASLLSYHVLPAKVFAAKMGTEGPATTLSGEEVTFDVTNGLKVNGSGVQARNIEATNGIIHALDTVLTPPVKQMAAIASAAGTASAATPISISPAPQDAQTDGHSQTPTETAESGAVTMAPPITPAIS